MKKLFIILIIAFTSCEVPTEKIEITHKSENGELLKTETIKVIPTIYVKAGNFLEECHRPTGALVVWKVRMEEKTINNNYALYTLIDDNGCVFHQEEGLKNWHTKPKHIVGDTINKGRY